MLLYSVRCSSGDLESFWTWQGSGLVVAWRVAVRDVDWAGEWRHMVAAARRVLHHWPCSVTFGDGSLVTRADYCRVAAAVLLPGSESSF